MSAHTETIPDHVTHDFLTWLWYLAETTDKATLPDGTVIPLWVDTRMAFRAVGDLKPSAVLTGDNPAATPEARAALRGGKVIQELRVVLRRDDREYIVTLGPGLQLRQAKLPTAVRGGDFGEALYERAFLYEDLVYIIAQLFNSFAAARVSPEWTTVTAPDMRRVFAAVSADADPAPDGLDT